MNKKTAVLATFLFFITASLSSFASTVHSHGHDHGHGCGGGGGGGGVGCTPTETYNEVLTTSTFTDVGWLTNKQTFSFDPLQSPGEGFQIESVFLTVNTNSNGIGDYIWTKVGFLDWDKVGKLSDSGTDTFELDKSLFDLVMNGITFKAWFSCCLEDITLATLTINGVYCDSTPVPLPGAVWLFGSAFAGLVGFSKRRKNQS